MKIGPVDTGIALLKLIKRKKLRRVKYIALPASLLNGLKHWQIIIACQLCMPGGLNKDKTSAKYVALSAGMLRGLN